MKILVSILILILLFSCQNKNVSKKTEASEELTEVKIDETMHDFGIVTSGEIVAFNFTFTNVGDHDLIVNGAETDCGCVAVNIPENTIKPGKQGIIEVEFNSSGLFGKELKSIELDWNCKETKQLVIFATVENKEIEIIY